MTCNVLSRTLDPTVVVSVNDFYCLIFVHSCVAGSRSNCLLFCVVKPAVMEKKLFLIPPGHL